MMFPDTSNAQQSAALRQAAERSQAASNPQYEYAYSTWTPLPLRRERIFPSSISATRFTAAQEVLRLISR
jgi:hypothetical protein